MSVNLRTMPYYRGSRILRTPGCEVEGEVLKMKAIDTSYETVPLQLTMDRVV